MGRFARTWLAMGLFIVCVPLMVGATCGGDDDDDSGAATASPETAATEADGGTDVVVADDVEGHWSGDWGDMYLATDADGITRGAYPHDLGTVQGRIVDGVFIGWWCEAGSRQPPGDAGEVEFRFIRDQDGSLRMDGRWKYGSEGDWAENWDLALVATPIDEATRARLENDEEFCERP